MFCHTIFRNLVGQLNWSVFNLGDRFDFLSNHVYMCIDRYVVSNYFLFSESWFDRIFESYFDSRDVFFFHYHVYICIQYQQNNEEIVVKLYLYTESDHCWLLRFVLFIIDIVLITQTTTVKYMYEKWDYFVLSSGASIIILY